MEIKRLSLKTSSSDKLLSIGSGCVIMRDQSVLLVRGKGGDKFKFPGGHINDDETIRQAAEREAEEEIGTNIEIKGKPYLYQLELPEKGQILLFHYKAKIIEGTPQPTTEIEEIRWIKFPDLESMKLFENVIPAIKHFLN